MKRNADGSEGTAFVKEIQRQKQCVLPTGIISFASVGCLGGGKKGKGKLHLASLLQGVQWLARWRFCLVLSHLHAQWLCSIWEGRSQPWAWVWHKAEQWLGIAQDESFKQTYWDFLLLLTFSLPSLPQHPSISVHSHLGPMYRVLPYFPKSNYSQLIPLSPSCLPLQPQQEFGQLFLRYPHTLCKVEAAPRLKWDQFTPLLRTRGPGPCVPRALLSNSDISAGTVNSTDGGAFCAYIYTEYFLLFMAKETFLFILQTEESMAQILKRAAESSPRLLPVASWSRLVLLIERALCTSAVQYMHPGHAAYHSVIYKPTGTIYNGDFSTDG